VIGERGCIQKTKRTNAWRYRQAEGMSATVRQAQGKKRRHDSNPGSAAETRHKYAQEVRHPSGSNGGGRNGRQVQVPGRQNYKGDQVAVQLRQTICGGNVARGGNQAETQRDPRGGRQVESNRTADPRWYMQNAAGATVKTL